MQKKFDEIFLMGDIHGSYRPIAAFFERNPSYFKKEICLILLGDVGLNYFGPGSWQDKKLKERIAKKENLTLFCIRGNHEMRVEDIAKTNPNWRLESFFDNDVWVEDDYPNIKYALDIVSVYNIQGYKTLVIPGAYSVDKFYRLSMGYNWFANEQLSETEQKIGLDVIDLFDKEFDLVLSHTCPSIFVPTDLFISFVDQNTVDNSMERYLGSIEYSIKYKTWCWGHYHAYREYPRDLAIPSYENPRQLMLDGFSSVTLNEAMHNPATLRIR